MRQRKGIGRRLLMLHLFIISLTVVLLEVVFFVSIYQYYYKNTEQLLSSHAKNAGSFAMRFTEWTPANGKNMMQDMLNEFQMQGTEMQIVSPTGAVLASSTGFLPNESISLSALHAAKQNEPSIWKGRNPGTDERVMATVVPLVYDDETELYFRYVISLENIDRLVERQGTIAVAIGIGIIVIVLLLSKALARKITTPLSQLTEASKRFAEGEFDKRIDENYIGELGTLAASFNDMCHSLLQHEKMKDQFISSISHELRTPLTSIKGWGETLLGGDLNDREETQQGMQIITSETERLIALVEELLDFSRMNTDTFQIHPSVFLLDHLIHEMRRQFEKQLTKKQIKLETECEAGLKVMADRNRVKQVLINLLDNAIKHSPPQSTVTLSCLQDHGALKMIVKDQGSGIRASDLPHIVSPFYKPNDKEKGVGLGLAISKHIIELHHGKLAIESEEGKGTIVTVRIPMESWE